MLKNKYLQELHVCFHEKTFFPSLPNLGAQIKCAQNWYTAVQMDLKFWEGLLFNCLILTLWL